MSKDNNSNNNGKKEYKVGYKKPPKHTQFGQPGGNKPNTKGRPPGRNVQEIGRLSQEAIGQCFLDSAQRPVPIRQDGEEFVVPLISALAKRMAQDALNGDRHARRDFLRILENAAKDQDKVLGEMHSLLAGFRERLQAAIQRPGSLKCFNAFYDWFMVKRGLRVIDGPESWPYEEGEPVTDEDWSFFIERHEFLKSNPHDEVPWPVKYPGALARKEKFQELIREYSYKLEMRAKEEEAGTKDPDDTATVEQAKKKAQAARKKPPEAE